MRRHHTAAPRACRGVLHDVRGPPDRGLDVAVARVQQRPPDHQAAHARHRQRVLPRREGRIRIGAGRAAEDQQRLRRHRRHLVDVRGRLDLQPRERRRVTERGAHADRLEQRVGVVVPHRLAVRVLRVRDRLDHRQHPPVAERLDGVGARGERRHRPRVALVDAQQHLAGIEAGRDQVVGVVGGEAVVELPARPGEPAAIHRADRHAIVERAEQHEVLEDVGAGEHAVDTRVGERDEQPVEHHPPVDHRSRLAAHADHRPRRVVGGDDEQVAIGRHAVAARPPGQRIGDRSRRPHPRVDQLAVLPVAQDHARTSSRCERASAARGSSEPERNTASHGHVLQERGHLGIGRHRVSAQ